MISPEGREKERVSKVEPWDRVEQLGLKLTGDRDNGAGRARDDTVGQSVVEAHSSIVWRE